MITVWQCIAFGLFTIILYYLSVEISRKTINVGKALLFSPIYIGWLFWLIMILLTIFSPTIKMFMLTS